MDQRLSYILDNSKLRVESCGQFALKAPWGLRKDASDKGGFLFVAEGQCCLAVDGVVGHRTLFAGDFIFFTRFIGHSVADSPSTPLLRFGHSEASSLPAMGSLSLYGGEGCTTRIYVGRVLFDLVTNPLLGALPNMMIYSKHADKAQDTSLKPVIESIVNEAVFRLPGALNLMNALARTLLAMTAAETFEPATYPTIGTAPSQPLSPGIDKVLAAIHSKPEDHWTLQRLADEAEMSRSGFVATFSSQLHATPLNYLTRVRIHRAQSLIASGMPVKRVVSAAGFRSSSAFNRAFRRVSRQSPSQFRSEVLSNVVGDR